MPDVWYLEQQSNLEFLLVPTYDRNARRAEDTVDFRQVGNLAATIPAGRQHCAAPKLSSPADQCCPQLKPISLRNSYRAKCCGNGAVFGLGIWHVLTWQQRSPWPVAVNLEPILGASLCSRDQDERTFLSAPRRQRGTPH